MRIFLVLHIHPEAASYAPYNCFLSSLTLIWNIDSFQSCFFITKPEVTNGKWCLIISFLYVSVNKCIPLRNFILERQQIMCRRTKESFDLVSVKWMQGALNSSSPKENFFYHMKNERKQVLTWTKETFSPRAWTGIVLTQNYLQLTFSATPMKPSWAILLSYLPWDTFPWATSHPLSYFKLLKRIILILLILLIIQISTVLLGAWS